MRDFFKLGYEIIPGVFSKQEMENACMACDWLVSLSGIESSLQRINGFPALLFNADEHSATLRLLSRDKRLKKIVREILGDSVFRLNNQLYFRNSGDGDEFAWHQDVCFRTPPEDFDGIEEGYLQTIIALEDIDDNGAIEFMPGSHKLGDVGLIPRNDSEKGLRKFNRGIFVGEKIKAKAGDVLIWSVMIVHGSEKNQSGRSRKTLMNGFAREDVVLNKSKFERMNLAGY